MNPVHGILPQFSVPLSYWSATADTARPSTTTGSYWVQGVAGGQLEIASARALQIRMYVSMMLCALVSMLAISKSFMLKLQMWSDLPDFPGGSVMLGEVGVIQRSGKSRLPAVFVVKDSCS
jgi:hypothetical protein